MLNNTSLSEMALIQKEESLKLHMESSETVNAYDEYCRRIVAALNITYPRDVKRKLVSFLLLTDRTFYESIIITPSP
jgi:hypothetical protein